MGYRMQSVAPAEVSELRLFALSTTSCIRVLRRRPASASGGLGLAPWVLHLMSRTSCLAPRDSCDASARANAHPRWLENMPLLDALTVSAVQFFFAHRGESMSYTNTYQHVAVHRNLHGSTKDVEDQYSTRTDELAQRFSFLAGGILSWFRYLYVRRLIPLRFQGLAVRLHRFLAAPRLLDI
jgi:hypothetical protein